MASPPRINKNINNNNNNDESHSVTPKRKLERPSLLTTKENPENIRKQSLDNLSTSSKSPMRSRASTGTFRKRTTATTEDEISERRISNPGDEEIPERDSNSTMNLKKRRTEESSTTSLSSVQANVHASSSPRFLRPQQSIEEETTTTTSLNSSQSNSNNNLAGELHTGCTQQLNSMNFGNQRNTLSQESNFHINTLFGIVESDNRPEIPNSEYFEHLNDPISPITRLPNPQVSTPIARTNNNSNLSSEVATSTIRSIFNTQPQDEPPNTQYNMFHQDSGLELDHSNNTNPHFDLTFDIPFHLSEYKNAGHLGSGGSSIVYKAIPPTGNYTELTAIKRFENPQDTDSPDLRKKRESNRTQALQEVRILSYLHSTSHGYCPTVMQAIRHDQSDFYDYIELELMDDSLDNLMCERQHLKDRLLDSGFYRKEKIERSHSVGCRLDLVSHFTSQIVEGLAHCHNNDVIHRDIKSQNILVQYNGNLIKIADFGLSCFKTAEKLTDIVGTPSYFAPEMWFTHKFVAGNRGLEAYAKIVPNANTDTMTIQELEKERTNVAEKLASFGKSLDSYIGCGEKIDIWALGCVLVQLASGIPLYAQHEETQMICNECLNFENHDCSYSLNKALGMLPDYLKDDPLYDSFVSFLGLCLVHCPDDRADINELMIHEFIYDEMSSEEAP